MGFNIDNPSRLLQPWRDIREFSEQMYAMMTAQQEPEVTRPAFNYETPELAPSSHLQSEGGNSEAAKFTPQPRRPPSAASGSTPSVAQARRTEAATSAASVASQVTVPRPAPPAAPSFGTGHDSTFNLPAFSSPTFTSAYLTSTQRTPPPFVQAAEALGAKTPYSIAPPVAILPVGINFLDPNNLPPVRQYNPPPVGFISGSLLSPVSCYVSPATSFTSGDLLPPAVCKRPPTPALLTPGQFKPLLTDPWKMIESLWEGALPEKNEGFTPSLGGGVADPALVGFVTADIGPGGQASSDGWLMGSVDLYDNGPPGKTAGDQPSATVQVVFEGVLHTDIIPSGTWIFNIQLYQSIDQEGGTSDVYYAGIPVWFP